ncbi:MAG: hypothetical protein ACRDHL_15070 [Candidatus Promineifilaceae bacterium]
MPGPAWLAFASLLFAHLLLSHALQWLSGTLAPGTFDGALVVAAFYPFYFLTLTYYLNEVAHRSLEAFRPAVEIDESEYARLRFELTTALARLGLVAIVPGVALALALIATDPSDSGIAGSTITAVFMGLLGTACIVLPLSGMHRRLSAEKERLLAEANQHLEEMIADLRQPVRSRSLEKMDDVNKAMASLILEREVLDKISTWPWEPGTLRGFISALGLPIVLYLIAAVLGHLFSF